MSLTKPKLQLSEMLEYKFQILVDGYSAAWDSSQWKLSSGSVVFYVLPQSNLSAPHQVGYSLMFLPLSAQTSACFLLHQPWALWWYPALQPDVHYVRTTASELPAALKHCLEDKVRLGLEPGT